MLNNRILSPTKLGALLGFLSSTVVGFVYIVVLREPTSAFYLFAGLAMLAGPLLAGIIAVRRAREHKLHTGFAATGIVFGIVCVLFVFIYAIYIRVYTTRVQIPAYCDGTYTLAARPPNLSYILPDGTTGILLLSDAQTSIVANVDETQLARPTTLFLINKTNKILLGSITFPSDIVAVAMDTSTVYFFYDGLGHSIHKDTGTYEPYFLTMDAYGRNNDGYFETTGVFSHWSTDGSMKLHPHLTFNGIAQGCYIAGDTQRITKL